MSCRFYQPRAATYRPPIGHARWVTYANTRVAWALRYQKPDRAFHGLVAARISPGHHIASLLTVCHELFSQCKCQCSSASVTSWLSISRLHGRAHQARAALLAHTIDLIFVCRDTHTLIIIDIVMSAGVSSYTRAKSPRISRLLNYHGLFTSVMVTQYKNTLLPHAGFAHIAFMMILIIIISWYSHKYGANAFNIKIIVIITASRAPSCTARRRHYVIASLRFHFQNIMRRLFRPRCFPFRSEPPRHCTSRNA